MSQFQSRIETEVIRCDNIKWKSVVLLYSALTTKEYSEKLCVIEEEDTFSIPFPAKAPEIYCCLV